MKIKTILTLTAAAVSAVLLCGCYNSRASRSAALRYMKKQYGSRFTYLEDYPSGGDVYGRHSEKLNIYAECEDLPGMKIHVYSVDGIHFASDYINKYYEEDTIGLVKSLAEQVYDDTELRVALSEPIVNDMEDGTELDEFLASDYLNKVDIYTTNNDDPEGDFAKLVDLLTENKINCSPSTYHFTENIYGDEDFKPRSADTRYKAGWAFIQGGFTLDKDLTNDKYQYWTVF